MPAEQSPCIEILQIKWALLFLLKNFLILVLNPELVYIQKLIKELAKYSLE